MVPTGLFMKLKFAILFTATTLLGGSLWADDKELFQDGDLVVFLGGTLVERAQEYGYWEAAIQLANPDKTLHIRNFGWSGDTVWAESRGQFDPPAKGYERMIEQVKAVKPNVIVFGYGNAEAFNGEQGLEAFVTQYRKLIGDLPDCRRLFLGPMSASPVKAAQNRDPAYHLNLQKYDEAIKDLANEFGKYAGFDSVISLNESDTFDKNGMHLNRVGYMYSALFMIDALGLVGEEEDESPSPLDPLFVPNPERQVQTLLEAIVAKNRLVFYRWRPQNITYLTLFRKHEQGNNYAEIPQFDPLIDKADAEIDRIKREVAASSSK